MTLSSAIKKFLYLIAVLILQGCSNSNSNFEVVSELQQAPINVAVSADHRIFLSFQQGDSKVGELLPDGSITDLDLGNEASGIFGLKVSADNILWMIDAGLAEDSEKLIAWDIENESIAQVIELNPPEEKTPRFFQDFALDQSHQMAYIADMGFDWTQSKPALWRVNLQTGELKLLLNNHPKLQQEERHMSFNGQQLTAVSPVGFLPPQFGLNPITIDQNDEWVYFGSMEGSKVYRLSTADLMNDELTADELAERIETVADKPYSDGISIDNDGNIYVTDLENNGIGMISSEGSYQQLFSDDRIQWPDGLSCAPDNWIYATTNQYHLNAAFNRGVQIAKAPYYLIRFTSKAPCTIGR